MSDRDDGGRENAPMPERHDEAEGDRDVKERRRSGSRDRRRRSRERRPRSRSGSRDRRRRNRSRSSDRYRSRRSRSRDRSRDRRRRSRSHEGYRGPARTAIGAGPPPSTDPYAAIRQPMPSAVDPLEIQRLWQEQQLRARQLVLQQQAVSAKSAASKTQREVYVGNLVPGAISDAMLQQIFNTALMVRFPGSNIPGMEPVIKVNIHKDGRYAFVELRTPEMATAAMDLSGQVQFLGQAMSVNRPSGYVDPVKVTAAASAATTALHAFQTGATPGLPASMPGMPAVTMPQQLPMPPAMPGMYNPAPVQHPGMPAQQQQYPMAPQMQYGMPPAAAAPAPSPGPGGVYIDGASAMPTTAVCVLGMVGADVLMNDLEYDDVIEDLKQECEKQSPGSVLQIKVPRPPQPEMSSQLINTGNYGKAFVLFRDAVSAQRARDAIHGRTFAGKAIQVVFVTPDAFARAQ